MGTRWRDELRRELLLFVRADGGLDILDLLQERLHPISAATVAAFDTGCAEALQLLERLHLVEGPTIDAMREAAYQYRREHGVRTPVDAKVVPIDWGIARQLPAMVASCWRDPKRWRRLAEDRAAGQAVLTLRDFLSLEVLETIRGRVEQMPFQPLHTDLLSAERHLSNDDNLPQWRALLRSPELRALCGAVIGRPLSPGLIVNAWRMQKDHFMGPHPDGRRYQGTVSLGLCAEWRAQQGGAIAFGEMSATGFKAHQRWLPHAGDLCLFAPTENTWHEVEPIRTGVRYTVTAWWVPEDEAL